MAKFIGYLLFVFSSLTCAEGAGAAPSSDQICQKMIADNRGNDQSQSQCLCAYRVANAVLDEDIKALLFDAWFTGTDNMERLEKLPKQNRVRKQLRSMDLTLQRNCK